MAKYKHGFPVRSTVVVGYLASTASVDRNELIKLASAMVMSEEGNQDFPRMLNAFSAKPRIAASFALPEDITPVQAWSWRGVGCDIIRDAFAAYLDRMQQTQAPEGRMQRAQEASQIELVCNLFKSRLEKEHKLAVEALRNAMSVAKYKHGFPVCSTVVIGYLASTTDTDRNELILLASAMVVSEEDNQDFQRMLIFFSANQGIATSFAVPERVNPGQAWSWRFAGFGIIKDAFVALTGMKQNSKSEGRAREASQIEKACSLLKSRLEKEHKLLSEAAKKAMVE